MYSASKLKTTAECDLAIASATSRKESLVLQQANRNYDLNGQAKAVALANASLTVIKAQIAGLEAAITDAEGTAKVDLQDQLRKLNDKRENLDERLRRGGINAILETELDTEISKKQAEEIDAFIDTINNRKNEL